MLSLAAAKRDGSGLARFDYRYDAQGNVLEVNERYRQDAEVKAGSWLTSVRREDGGRANPAALLALLCVVTIARSARCRVAHALRTLQPVAAEPNPSRAVAASAARAVRVVVADRRSGPIRVDPRLGVRRSTTATGRVAVRATRATLRTQRSARCAFASGALESAVDRCAGRSDHRLNPSVVTGPARPARAVRSRGRFRILLSPSGGRSRADTGRGGPAHAWRFRFFDRSAHRGHHDDWKPGSHRQSARGPVYPVSRSSKRPRRPIHRLATRPAPSRRVACQPARVHDLAAVRGWQFVEL